MLYTYFCVFGVQAKEVRIFCPIATAMLTTTVPPKIPAEPDALRASTMGFAVVAVDMAERIGPQAGAPRGRSRGTPSG